MVLSVTSEPVPLTTDKDDVIRVGDTRVALDRVIYSFLAGATPEQIVQQYDTLELADVYAVIAYYLRHREEVELYLQEQKIKADALRQEIEWNNQVVYLPLK
jgi:uncharacterized protein (DUF433 family)